MCIYVRPWVLYFTQVFQDWRYCFVYQPNDVHEFIVCEVFLCKLHLSGKPWISFAQYGMTITWYYLTFCQCFLYVISDLFFGRDTAAQFFAHAKDPLDYFLVSQTMQRTCK